MKEVKKLKKQHEKKIKDLLNTPLIPNRMLLKENQKLKKELENKDKKFIEIIESLDPELSIGIIAQIKQFLRG
jgi:hypothetical protein